jgi:UDP-N-acetylmuramate dehydrogenase
LQSAEALFTPLENVNLAPLTTLRVGGNARWFARADKVEDVVAAFAWCADRDVQLFVLGGGSNLVVADDGFQGLVAHVALRGRQLAKASGETVLVAGAGEPWDEIVNLAVSHGLAGLECLSGIPGRVGGTPIQNVGAYGQEVSDSIDSVAVFDREAGCVTELSNTECRFAYRSSRFKREDTGRFVVTAVTFRLKSLPPDVVYEDVINQIARDGKQSPTVHDVREAVLTIRRRKGMVTDRSS